MDWSKNAKRLWGFPCWRWQDRAVAQSCNAHLQQRCGYVASCFAQLRQSCVCKSYASSPWHAPRKHAGHEKQKSVSRADFARRETSFSGVVGSTSAVGSGACKTGGINSGHCSEPWIGSIDAYQSCFRRTLVAFMIAGASASCSTTRPQSPSPQPEPLAVANCPLLAPLEDDTFGGWVLWAQYVVGQYAKCRAAALGVR